MGHLACFLFSISASSERDKCFETISLTKLKNMTQCYQ